MTSVLVVERREPPRAAAVLAAEGFFVVTAINPAEARAALTTFEADLVVIESPSLGAQVLDACEAIRAAGVTPIVVVSGPYSERDAVAAFSAGVDGLIHDNVGGHEFVARIRALLRRSPQRRRSPDDRIVVGPIVLDSARRELSVHGVGVRLPKREFDIAQLLMRDAGRVVSRQRIMRELWVSSGDTKSLDVQVGRLRMRLAAAEGRQRIVTVRGVGYRLMVDDDSIDASLEDDVDITPSCAS
jgi:DNA-binding response OmpR family regulator